MYKEIFTILLCGILFTGCNSKHENSNYTGDVSGSVTLKVGDTFIIRLESNPTTGYSWALAKPESDIVEQVSKVYEPSNTSENIVGSGGTEVWTFKAKAKGQIILTFQYIRPWEKDIPPIKEETYSIIVK